MNNFGPIIPPGTFLEPQNRTRARFRVAVFIVLAVHGFGLLALLMQGCHRPTTADLAAQLSETNTPPAFEQPTNAPVALDPSIPPVKATNAPPLPAPPVAAPLPTPPVATRLAPTPTTTAAPGSEYRIAKGDTFRTIARRFHVPLRDLMNANPGLRATHLKIGQTIHIPVRTASAPGGSSTAVAIATR